MKGFVILLFNVAMGAPSVVRAQERGEGRKAMQQEHDGPAVRPGLAVEDVDAADGGGAVVDGPGAVGGSHCVRSSDDFCV